MSLSDSKSSQISRAFLSILDFSSLFTRFLETFSYLPLVAPSPSWSIDFFSTRAKSWIFPVFRFHLFSQCPVGSEKSTWWWILFFFFFFFFCELKFGLVMSPGSKDPSVSQNDREFYLFIIIILLLLHYCRCCLILSFNSTSFIVEY